MEERQLAERGPYEWESDYEESRGALAERRYDHERRAEQLGIPREWLDTAAEQGARGVTWDEGNPLPPVHIARVVVLDRVSALAFVVDDMALIDAERRRRQAIGIRSLLHDETDVPKLMDDRSFRRNLDSRWLVLNGYADLTAVTADERDQVWQQICRTRPYRAEMYRSVSTSSIDRLWRTLSSRQASVRVWKLHDLLEPDPSNPPTREPAAAFPTPTAVRVLATAAVNEVGPAPADGIGAGTAAETAIGIDNHTGWTDDPGGDRRPEPHAGQGLEP
ncbi:hypothetical protein [Nocardia transvalensis]|uniref:hypothetical protein n=1 Tax=Nocardia transvalensis TaxID=37333 RepID=UPI001893C69E|nr:hypothetical protein [Nocardia transvalensis]MBF6331815.1 hypothetical protein [Nocardia transvalensis]